VHTLRWLSRRDRDLAALRRAERAVRGELSDDRGDSTATAVRIVWPGDPLDAARRLQGIVVEPARERTARERTRG